MEFRILFQVRAGCIVAAAEGRFSVCVRRAGLYDQTMLFSKREELSLGRNALVVENIKFAGAEWRSDFVFDDFNLGAVADNFFA